MLSVQTYSTASVFITEVQGAHKLCHIFTLGLIHFKRSNILIVNRRLNTQHVSTRYKKQSQYDSSEIQLQIDTMLLYETQTLELFSRML